MTTYGLAVLFLTMTTSSFASTSSLPTCPEELEPEVRVAPQLPPRLHNRFIGYAEVAVVIGPSGDVQSPTITAEEWQPLGRSGGKPFGYHEAILTAVAQWRYEQRQHACRHMFPIRFVADDSE